MKPKLYLIGSLRNPAIPELANRIRNETDIEPFCDWYAAGCLADDCWRDFCKSQGWGLIEALSRPAAVNVFEFDRHHLETSDMGALIMPAGKSGHLELGFLAGLGKPTFICLEEESERWDVMLGFAGKVVMGHDALIEELKGWGNAGKRQ